ncbi:MAG: hypothetical protein LBN26_07230 [Christensenellaceae bacterium]|nr:hypothetical protein [Christensenellaceae bacterium]
MFEKALENGDNIVYPKLEGIVDSIRNIATLLHKKGYTAHLILNELPIDKAMERNNSRYQETGRLVSPKILMDVGNKPIRTFLELEQEGVFDGYERYTNDVERGAAPEKVLGVRREREADGLRRGRGERRYDSGIVGMDDGTEESKVAASSDGVTDGIPYSVGAATPTTKLGESQLYMNTYLEVYQEGAFDDYDRRTNDVKRGESPRKVPREQWQGILGNQRSEVLGDGRERGADVLRRGRGERRPADAVGGMADGTAGGEAVAASPDGVTDGIPYSVGAATPTTKLGESQLYTNTYLELYQEGVFDDYDRRTNDVERGESPRKVPREQWQGIPSNQRSEILGDGRERGADVLRRGGSRRGQVAAYVGSDTSRSSEMESEAVAASPDGVTDGIP